MPDLSPNSNSNPDPSLDTGVELKRESAPSTPRWLKVFGIITLALILLVVIILVFGGGNHGPNRHRLPSSVIEQSVQQP